MKYIKTYEKKIKYKDYYYKVPTYPFEKYFISLTKLGMTDAELKRWSINTHSQYWNNEHYKFILMIKDYNEVAKEYQWGWTDYRNSGGIRDIIEIEVSEEELDAHKYNL